MLISSKKRGKYVKYGLEKGSGTGRGCRLFRVFPCKGEKKGAGSTAQTLS